ncbi:uncharacterized protein LOC100819033 [Glycine max]|uniref:uncharacterized protein LOC100819033 n=1 Tax=Glycine max TaxID=3847 RepID=UPI0009B54E11|nr:uncharacterized protein LOC100819033 [Glycine max]|eukprot:NP_001336835.1 uncharacterized protein LOC100819033 [Glycine max]
MLRKFTICLGLRQRLDQLQLYGAESIAWRFWHFHVTNLVSKNQKAMIKLWILSALASNLNSPSFISEWGQLCSFVQILEVGGNGEFLVMIFSGTFPSSWLIRMDK